MPTAPKWGAYGPVRLRRKSAIGNHYCRNFAPRLPSRRLRRLFPWNGQADSCKDKIRFFVDICVNVLVRPTRISPRQSGAAGPCSTLRGCTALVLMAAANDRTLLTPFPHFYSPFSLTPPLLFSLFFRDYPYLILRVAGFDFASAFGRGPIPGNISHWARGGGAARGSGAVRDRLRVSESERRDAPPQNRGRGWVYGSHVSCGGVGRKG